MKSIEAIFDTKEYRKMMKCSNKHMNNVITNHVETIKTVSVELFEMMIVNRKALANESRNNGDTYDDTSFKTTIACLQLFIKLLQLLTDSKYMKFLFDHCQQDFIDLEQRKASMIRKMV
jgi:hypothetical protein